MEATALRVIKPGTKYDKLFPIPYGKNITIENNATLEDTLNLIKKTVPLTLKDTQAFVDTIPEGSLRQVCETIWQFVYDHIAYKRDEKGKEQIRRPARAWMDRQSGVDCDCYSEFISSCLTNLGIPHKLRITKYSLDTFQHIYPVVPKDGNLDKPLTNRRDYITMDCVKEAFDDEQPYTEFKDFPMRLEFLNGFEDQHEVGSVDSYDIGSTNDFEMNGDAELNGRFGKWLKNTASKVGNTVKKGVRFLNRFTNPATILLRNGFLLCMKINFLRVANKLRFAYLTDEQAKQKNMNMDAFAKLKKIRDKAENIYEMAGGKKENLKKAILKGKGNKDHAVPMSGFEFEGMDGLDGDYADEQEYNIIKYGNLRGVYDEMGDLGDPATGASIAAATSAITAIAGALSQVKGLFKKDSPAAQEFNQSSESGGGSSPSITSEDTATAPDTSSSNESTSESAQNSMPVPANPDRAELQYQQSGNRNASGSANVSISTSSTTPKSEGFVQKTTTWIKANPGKTLLIAGLALGGGFMLLKKKTPQRGLNGFSSRKTRRRKKAQNSGTAKRKSKVTTIKF